MHSDKQCNCRHDKVLLICTNMGRNRFTSFCPCDAVSGLLLSSGVCVSVCPSVTAGVLSNRLNLS